MMLNINMIVNMVYKQAALAPRKLQAGRATAIGIILMVCVFQHCYAVATQRFANADYSRRFASYQRADDPKTGHDSGVIYWNLADYTSYQVGDRIVAHYNNNKWYHAVVMKKVNDNVIQMVFEDCQYIHYMDTLHWKTKSVAECRPFKLADGKTEKGRYPSETQAYRIRIEKAQAQYHNAKRSAMDEYEEKAQPGAQPGAVNQPGAAQPGDEGEAEGEADHGEMPNEGEYFEATTLRLGEDIYGDHIDVQGKIQIVNGKIRFVDNNNAAHYIQFDNMKNQLEMQIAMNQRKERCFNGAQRNCILKIHIFQRNNTKKALSSRFDTGMQYNHPKISDVIEKLRKKFEIDARRSDDYVGMDLVFQFKNMSKDKKYIKKGAAFKEYLNTYCEGVPQVERMNTRRRLADRLDA